MTEKSELKATLSARLLRVDTIRPTVESETELLLNTAGPCSFGSRWILPSQMVHTGDGYDRRGANSYRGAGVTRSIEPTDTALRLELT